MEIMNNPFSLEGKTILITGASSGIGRTTAVACSNMGARLIITGRNKEHLDETFKSLFGSGHFQVISDLKGTEGRDYLIERTPCLDGLVHCAGISGHQIFTYLKDDTLQDMFSINFFAPTFLTKELLKQRKINKSASIVFMTSTSGIISSYIGGSAYSSTKGALNGLIKGMALDLAPKGIRVNSVMAAMVHTSIMDGGTITEQQFLEDMNRYPLKRYGRPDEVAYAIIYLLSNASSWTTGTNLLLDGGRTISY
jgi:NAD(P)-dependent dehydrogenase (short-subunit alcohol dehydrogenase family)